MKLLSIAFVCVVWAVTCHTDRSFRYEERMTIKDIIRTFVIDGKPAKSLYNLRKSGHGVNCGPVDTKLNVTWTPEPIIAGKDTTIYVSMVPGKYPATKIKITDFYDGPIKPIKMCAEVDFATIKVMDLTKGTANISVYLGSSTEGEPMFGESLSMTCSEARKQLPGIKCPVEKGVPVEAKYSFEMPTVLEGLYTVKVNVKNEKGKQFACAKLTVHLQIPGK